MSTTSKSQTESKEEAVAAGGLRSEPVGRAEQPAGGGPLELPVEVRGLLSDEVIDDLYSRGLSTRDIERHLADLYGVNVGRDLISRVTDAVMDDVREWQQRPLDDVYPVIFLDALVLKIREGGTVQRRACYLALGVSVEGERAVLGMWFQESEGAKFWMQVLSELKQRGVPDVLLCCVDGLTGFPEALEAIYADTVVQTCVVHLIRHSLVAVRVKRG